MHSALLLEKSTARYAAKKVVSTCTISEVLNALDPSFLSQFTGLEVAEDGNMHASFYSVPVTFSATPVDTEPAASEEVYVLTQVILNTINTEPSQFHDMLDIPGLEDVRWEVLAQVAQYLISQGWLESKAVENKLLVKLTIEGKLYLRYNNAWS